MAATQTSGADLHVALPNKPLLLPKGDVSFVQKLPPELLSRVFEFGTVNDGDSDEEVDRPTHFWDADDFVRSSAVSCPRHQFPVVASGVCRHWRTVAYSTPSLWTTIVITSTSTSPYLHEATSLTRSRSLPVDIYIEFSDECEESEGSSDDLRLLSSILIQHIHRWRTMEVVGEYYYISEFLEAISLPATPAASRLEKLKLSAVDQEDFDEFIFQGTIIHPTLFGGHAPSLTTVILSGVHVDWDQPWIASMSNVIDLRLMFHSYDVRPSWAQFATILRGASALKRLTLHMSGPKDWFVEPRPGVLSPPIQLPQLTDLVLGRHSEDCAISLIQQLHFPSLKNLVINFEEDDYTEFIEKLVGPAPSIFPMEETLPSLLRALKSLEIRGLWSYENDDDDFVEVLYGELQNLTLLKIDLSSVSSQFLNVLGASRGRSDVWLPQLTALSVSGAGGDAIRQVVQKRQEMGVPLSAVYIPRWCEDMVQVPWLRENVEVVKFIDPMGCM